MTASDSRRARITACSVLWAALLTTGQVGAQEFRHHHHEPRHHRERRHHRESRHPHRDEIAPAAPEAPAEAPPPAAISEAPAAPVAVAPAPGLAEVTAPAASPAPPPEDDPSTAEARRRYAQGAVFFRANRYEEAIAEFNEAYALWTNPTILYSLAQAQERMLHVGRAIDLYNRYLATAPADAPHREEAAETIRGLTSLLADVRIESNVPAHVFADDDEIAVAPATVQLPIGRHQVDLRAAGYVAQRQSITLAARTRRQLTFALAPVPPPPREPTRLAPGWFWASAGLTGAVAITAASLGALTLSRAGDFDNNPSRTQAEREGGATLAAATDVSGGAAVLLAAVTVVVGLNTRWNRPAAPPRLTLMVLPGAAGAAVGGTF